MFNFFAVTAIVAALVSSLPAAEVKVPDPAVVR